jgi:hypothetical protein
MEDVMCERIVKFIRDQRTKQRREMFLNLVKAFATEDQNEGTQILYGKVDPVIKREDIRDMIMSLSDDLFKVIPFERIRKELEPAK